VSHAGEAVAQPAEAFPPKWVEIAIVEVPTSSASRRRVKARWPSVAMMRAAASTSAVRSGALVVPTLTLDSLSVSVL
jgi:hypothetical protein